MYVLGFNRLFRVQPLFMVKHKLNSDLTLCGAVPTGHYAHNSGKPVLLTILAKVCVILIVCSHVPNACFVVDVISTFRLVASIFNACILCVTSPL